MDGPGEWHVLSVAAAQYILTDPNIQVLAAVRHSWRPVTRWVNAYRPSGMFDQGIMVGSNLGKKWSHNETVNYFAVRQPNQIQLASTAAAPHSSPIIHSWRDPYRHLGGNGNATTAAGRATYFASDFHAVRRGLQSELLRQHDARPQLTPSSSLRSATHNTGASLDDERLHDRRKFGQTARMGDMQFQYQYFYKPANGIYFPVHHDDVGTGSGVTSRRTNCA